MKSRAVTVAVSIVIILLAGIVSGYLLGVNSQATRVSTYTSTATSTTTLLGSTTVTSTSVSTSTIVSTVTSTGTVTQTNYVINGGFESGFYGWDPTTGNQTILLTRSDPHSGAYAAEFITKKGTNSTGGLFQHFLDSSGGQCTTPGPAPTHFGVAVRGGLELSLWFRTPNFTANRIIATVTFHNGTSKLSIDYLLAWKGTVYSATLKKDQGGLQAYVPVLVNNSGADWRQAKFDIHQDFMKYFGMDPVASHYCVNYIAIGQGDNNGTEYSGGNIRYTYFDDVELNGVSQ